jgi:hypothetical protein
MKEIETNFSPWSCSDFVLLAVSTVWELHCTVPLQLMVLEVLHVLTFLTGTSWEGIVRVGLVPLQEWLIQLRWHLGLTRQRSLAVFY